MNRISALSSAVIRGRQQFETMMASSSCRKFTVEERYDLRWSEMPEKPETGRQLRLDTRQMRSNADAAANEDRFTGRIGASDNLDYMVYLLKQENMAGKIQLIYVDPPFFTGIRYQASVQVSTDNLGKSPVIRTGAYDDKWDSNLEEYLSMLAVRFWLMHELLADTGSLWVHLDWHGAHYVKMMLDEIFGHERFVNEVIWTYKSGGASGRAFARKHDTLLFYARTADYLFHPSKEKSYNRDGKPYRFRGVDEFEDEGGWYTMVNMKDVWSIDMVGRTSSERMGYATQKPEKLVERIVRACSDPGDLCADFFAGTGTLGAVCSRLGRPWIMCDEGQVAVADQILRMTAREGDFTVERPEDGQGMMAEADRKEDGVPRRARPEAKVSREENRLYLSGYRPDLALVWEKDRKTVFRYMEDDELCLMRFWSVDEASDGAKGTHEATKLFSGGDICTLSEGKTEGISIVGYDVFGGRFQWRG